MCTSSTAQENDITTCNPIEVVPMPGRCSYPTPCLTSVITPYYLTGPHSHLAIVRGHGVLGQRFVL